MIVEYFLSDVVPVTVAQDSSGYVTFTDDDGNAVYHKVKQIAITSAKLTAYSAASTGSLTVTPGTLAASTEYWFILGVYDTVREEWNYQKISHVTPASGYTATTVCNAWRSAINTSVLDQYGLTIGGTTTVTIAGVTAYPMIHTPVSDGVTTLSSSAKSGSLKTVDPSRETDSVTPTATYDRGEINFIEYSPSAAGATEVTQFKVVIFSDSSDADFRTTFADVLHTFGTATAAKAVASY